MYKISDCRSIINDELVRLESAMPEKPEKLYKPIDYILKLGGKRVRPTLVLLACNLFSKSIDSALSPAIAVEVFHNFTLLHDDIMDNSSLRRGKKTVNKLWDTNIAILSGDAMSILSYKLLSKTNPTKLPSVIDVFNKMAMEVCEGQQFDMDYEGIIEVSESDYMIMIRLKTAVLIAGSLKIGAICGNASEADAKLLYDFGINIGLAFQLQDDYLDVFGDEDVFGKKIGLDIIAKKKTLLLIKAFELANPEQKVNLNNILNSLTLSDNDKIDQVRNIYIDLKLDLYSKQRMSELYSKAMKALNNVSVDIDNKKELISLANELINRLA